MPAGCFVDPGVIDNATGPVSYIRGPSVFPVHATGGTQLVDSAAGCCTLCQSFANCSFWTFGYSGTAARPTCYGRPGACCYLKTADAWGQGIRVGPGNVSGSTAPLPPLIPPGTYPYPGPDFTHPRIHQSPECVHDGGWHDMAGALTFKGVHHAFQGCPNSGGWSHSTSTDLVHWKDLGVGMRALHETYEGMDSDSVPCAGFITVDDAGTPCAGFRQCSSGKGTTGLNPHAKSWDVPMELRCAENAALTNWSDPIYLYPVYNYRALPYDPVRPWKDLDGKWYSAWSSDGCNATTKKLPCAAGGQLELYTSPKLHGEGANWVQLEPMFTTNTTCSGIYCGPSIYNEFVTSGYFGGLPGDPDGGATRVVTQNQGHPSFWVGKQGNGSTFKPLWPGPDQKFGAVGQYDYGALTMARTLGGDPNQVATNGRRVLIGWIGQFGFSWPSTAAQSLARDLSLSPDYELLQQFVPELKVLRLPGTRRYTTTAAAETTAATAVVPHSSNGGSLRTEIVASFSWTGDNPEGQFGVSILDGTARLVVDCSKSDVLDCCFVMAGRIGPHRNNTGEGPTCTLDNHDFACASGPLFPLKTKTVHLHAIIDGRIIETIWNNRTAMVTLNVPVSETGTAVKLIGITANITADITTYDLDVANNAGPHL